jgi:hypothetical protein
MRHPHGLLLLAATLLAASASSCSSSSSTVDLGPATFRVTITSVNGNATLPTVYDPLPVNTTGVTEQWAFTIEALSPTGVLQPFNGFVGLSVVPGTVASVTGAVGPSGTGGADGGGADGGGTGGGGAGGGGAGGATTRGFNILLTDGTAQGVASVLGVYGPARLWVEDLGYVPTPPGQTPQCSNGLDDNDNGLIDFPSDPGCYAADDDTEDGGSYSAGVSGPVQHALPKISDVRGTDGAVTPYADEAVNIAASAPEQLVVTSVGSDGFYVTDVSPSQVKLGRNSLYAFNFSTPPNMRVCDTITQLSGTASDFYGFTQLSFPSWVNTYVILSPDAGTALPSSGLPDCLVPEPLVLGTSLFTGEKDSTAAALYPYEASLVRVLGLTSAKFIGPGLAVNNVFAVGQTNCDFNGDGIIEYAEIAPNCSPGLCEGDCANLCDEDPDCSEWNAYASQNAFKMSLAGNKDVQILVNAGTVSTFDPIDNAGRTVDMVSGNLTEFSGGNLNWTIAVRCSDDLVCPASMGCTTQVPLPPNVACIRARTTDDNDQGTD